MSESETNARDDSSLLLLLKGVLIGIAIIIPGVSGGTFALILGIYDRLIGAIRAFNAHTLGVALRALRHGFGNKVREELHNEAKRLDIWFLFRVGIGMAIAVLALSFIVEWCLVRYTSMTLAFFFGLLIPSLAVPWRMLTRKSVANYFWILPGIGVTLGIALAGHGGRVEGDNFFVAFGAGVAAIIAMILPGISGSYLLLMIGQYQNVLQKLQAVQLGIARMNIDWLAVVWMMVFGAGCGAGLLIGTRVLHLLLTRWRNATMMFLIGLIIGSFWVIWPFKNLEAGVAVKGRSGKVKYEFRVTSAPNRLPGFNKEALFCGGAFTLGLVSALGTNALGRLGQRSDAPHRC